MALQLVLFLCVENKHKFLLVKNLVEKEEKNEAKLIKSTSASENISS